MEIYSLLAKRTQGIKGSAIREIFKLLQQPDIISFAGGLPAPEMFPSKELSEISKDILENNGDAALQYNITEGYGPLRDIVGKRMSKINIGQDFDDIIIVSGAQQGIDLAAKAFINEGDGVICEQPTFIGGLNTFRSYNARIFTADIHEDGMNIEQVENILKSNSNIKLIYTIPTFQNPSGVTMSVDKRKRLLELANKYNVFIIEDNPYGELRFKGEDIQTIKSSDRNGRLIYVGSFSKILSPGLRIGWTVAHKSILEKMVIFKQVQDVHTNIFAQMLAVEYMNRYSIDEHIEEAKALYGKRCSRMLESMDKYIPDMCKYTRPEGGLFIWCTLPEKYDSLDIMKQCVENKVAFVPGNTFASEQDKPSSSFRLNYSTMSDEKIITGIKILGNVLEQMVNV